MAKQYEQFKKDFEAIKKAAVAGAVEIKKDAQAVAQFSQILLEGSREVGLRVQELKEQGQQGTALKDFLADPQVKKMSDELENTLNSLGKELKRITDLHQSQFKPLTARYATLMKELPAEIAARKKQLSTKLGTGNKSLADMEKLLTAVTKEEHDPALAAVMYFAPETLAEHRQQLDRQLREAIAKTKTAALGELQQQMDEQALEGRNRKRNVSQAKALTEQVLSECAKAQKALKERNQQELMRVKAMVGKPMKQLDTIAGMYERGSKDSWTKAAIEKSKDKAAILADMKLVIGWRDKARAELSKIANARLQG